MSVKPSRPENGKREFWDHLALISQVGLTMGGSIVIFLVAGCYMDQWVGGGGVLTILFTLLGVVGGGYTVYRQIMALEVDQARDPEDPDQGDAQPGDDKGPG